MTRTPLILLSLVAGVVAGIALRWADHPSLTAAATALLPIGQMWVRALQMTLIPLIFAMITHGVASAVRGGRGGAMIGTTLGVFAAIMVVTVVICTILVETALHIWPIPPHALAGLIGEAAPAPVPGLATQLLAIIPDNPVAAAAQGQIFPLVIFGLAFGIAIARLPQRETEDEPLVMALLAQVVRAMMQIVDWVLVIPMAVSVFRLGTVAHAVAAVLVAAHVVGIQPGPLQLVLAGFAVILSSISGAGLPGAAVVYAIYGPGIQLLGAPMAIMPLYVAVIALPDPIITMSSVTGDLTAAALIDRLLRRAPAR